MSRCHTFRYLTDNLSYSFDFRFPLRRWLPQIKDKISTQTTVFVFYVYLCVFLQATQHITEDTSSHPPYQHYNVSKQHFELLSSLAVFSWQGCFLIVLVMCSSPVDLRRNMINVLTHFCLNTWNLAGCSQILKVLLLACLSLGWIVV